MDTCYYAPMAIPDAQELLNGTRYVFYELATLFHARTIHAAAAKKQEMGSSTEYNAMWNAVQCCALESFLVHYRNLYEFFQNIDSGYDADSLMARHYAPAWTGDPEWRADKDEKKRINKLLAHISFKRLDHGPGSWNLDRMEQRVCRVFAEFVKQVASGETVFAKAVEIYKSRTKPTALVAFPGLGDASTTSVSHFQWWGFDLDLWK